jgi:predicted MFS family arabinose efflux permease
MHPVLVTLDLRRPGIRAAGAGIRHRRAAQRGAGAASRHAGADRGLRDPDGLVVLALTVASVTAPTAPWLALVLVIFGYGQGLVMAPLSSAVLSTVKPASADSGTGMYGTTQQIANAAGVAAIGAAFFAIEAARSARPALYASLALFSLSIITCVGFLAWMRREINCE